MSDTWTIGELAELAARALRAGGTQANGRVRDVPGERLIRWYTTIGLVDPPLTRRGRIARYGRRHLLQLVSIKRMQAAGHSIAEIQTALAGATDRMLEDAAGIKGPVTGAVVLEEAATLAGLADTPPPPDGRGGLDGAGRGLADLRTGGGARRGDEAVRDRFWTERPGMESAHRAAGISGDAAATDHRAGADTATPGSGTGPAMPDGRAGLATPGSRTDVTPDGRTDAATSGGTDAARTRNAPVGGGTAAALVVGVRLGDGVRLVLDVGRTPSEEDVQAVLAAAGPLLAVLEERELL
ncbi:helix-turn-helix domain-containing protein [Nonomuraea sp. 3N208]|uniref:helix-turn-helix domain-containing protein n=1 Tax=Nonomuraea sp. 3N208 TaxID=3457421 RepID=UPI003FCD0262